MRPNDEEWLRLRVRPLDGDAACSALDAACAKITIGAGSQVGLRGRAGALTKYDRKSSTSSTIYKLQKEE